MVEFCMGELSPENWQQISEKFPSVLFWRSWVRNRNSSVVVGMGTEAERDALMTFVTIRRASMMEIVETRRQIRARIIGAQPDEQTDADYDRKIKNGDSGRGMKRVVRRRNDVGEIVSIHVMRNPHCMPDGMRFPGA